MEETAMNLKHTTSQSNHHQPQSSSFNPKSSAIKRPSSAEPISRSGEKQRATKRSKNKTITQPVPSCSNQPSSGEGVVLPPYELLTKASELTNYHRALLLKRDQELLDLDQSLSIPFSKSKNESSKVRLEKVLRWKLFRGQYRPSLPGLVAQNSSQDVDRVVHQALDQLESCHSVDEATQSNALSTMCQLKGVGPATAAAFLSFEFPSLISVFSDEATSFFEKSLGSIKYTLPYYKRLNNLIKLKAQEISKPDDTWDVQRLERALWTFVLLKKHLSDEDWVELMGAQKVT